MKHLALTLVLSLFATHAFAESVSGYTRKDGTYVQGYERSPSNNTVTDNYSYKGNVNPSTGQIGTDTYRHDTTSPYYSGPDNNGRVGHGSDYR